LCILDSNEVSKLEPGIKCIKAILSPSTGVFDSSIYVQNLVADIENNNGNIIFNCTVASIKKNKNSTFEILTNQGSIESNIVVNAAGMHAPYLASKIEQYPLHLIPKQFYSKGNYFKIENNKAFKRLVYPIPSNGGLGIHATIDVDNNVKFGPDSEWLIPTSPSQADKDLIDHQYIFNEPPPTSAFQVNTDRSKLFYNEIKKYWPAISDKELVPDFAGIRPMLCGPSGTTIDDFVIETKSHHHCDNLINLYGIASPGLTSSLAIGNHVKNILFDNL
jgi:L-2-hydroxyglutarate oxidase LhgO